jgi:hypothetical protein
MYCFGFLPCEGSPVPDGPVLHEVPVVMVDHPQALFIIGFDDKEFWFSLLDKFIEFIHVVNGMLAEFAA